MDPGKEVRDRIFEFQHGVASDRQLMLTGMSQAQIKRWVSTGRLDRPFGGVVTLPGSPKTWLRDAWAAICWAGPGSAISGPAAARAMKMDGFSHASVEVTITRHKSSGGLPFRVRRVDERLIPEIIEIEGLPVTSVRRTILDLAGRKHRRAVKVLHEAFRRRLTDGKDMWRYVEQEYQRGRRGIAILRNDLKMLTGTEHLTDSEMENIFIAKVKGSRLPLPTPQHPIALPSQEHDFDFAYSELKLAIELDSGAWHDGPIQTGKDHRQVEEARNLGWTVLRFTWTQVMYEWDYVEATIRSNLKRG